MKHRVGAERGSVTVVMLGCVVLTAAVCLAVGRLGGAAVSSARADAAADAAALAAADMLALGRGAGAAEAAARQTAAANGARLMTCRCTGPTVTVALVLTGTSGTATGRARAEVHEECRFGC